MKKEYWVVTFFWNDRTDHKGTHCVGGYDTEWLDKHPADRLAEMSRKYGSYMHIVMALPISKEQYDVKLNDDEAAIRAYVNDKLNHGGE